jgi:hypothetical protein|tara:strand:+ start:3732 stop:3881 length:150 start_codon:yes stop_codon:yes gene_type:complete
MRSFFTRFSPRDAHESLRERHGVSSRHRKVIDDVVRVARGFARAHRRRD